MREPCYDTENGSVYCPECAPDIEPEYMGQETDSPLNCESCGCPLECTLTTEGVSYVIEQLLNALSSGIDNHVIPLRGTAEETMTYYHGSPHYEIMADWCRDLHCYSLSPAEHYVVDQYLERVDALEKSRKGG